MLFFFFPITEESVTLGVILAPDPVTPDFSVVATGVFFSLPHFFTMGMAGVCRTVNYCSPCHQRKIGLNPCFNQLNIKCQAVFNLCGSILIFLSSP